MSKPTAEEIVTRLLESAKAAVEAFKRDLHKVRTGRASTGLIEGVLVDFYGSKMALSHLAQLTTPENHLIVIQPYDVGAISAIEKAIQSSGLGLNPSKEGNLLRVSLPPLTQERRKDIVKHLHKLAEDFRVSIRNYRRDANETIKAMEKEGELSKDDAKRVLEKIQKHTDEQVSSLDALLQAKEKEVMSV